MTRRWLFAIMVVMVMAILQGTVVESSGRFNLVGVTRTHAWTFPQTCNSTTRCNAAIDSLYNSTTNLWYVGIIPVNMPCKVIHMDATAAEYANLPKPPVVTVFPLNIDLLPVPPHVTIPCDRFSTCFTRGCTWINDGGYPAFGFHFLYSDREQ